MTAAAPAPAYAIDPALVLAELRPTAHPLVPWLTEDEARACCRTEEGVRELHALFNEREAEVRRAGDNWQEGGDPIACPFLELPQWAQADAELKRVLREVRLEKRSVAGQYVAGGKRASKSERAARRVVQAALALRNGKIWCFQGSVPTSIAEQQRLVWKYLPKSLKALNGRARHGFTKINYTPDGGFAMGKSHGLVLPTMTEIHFLTYNQNPEDYTGWKLGAPLTVKERELIEKTPHLLNMGAWLDENATVEWIENMEARCSTNGACWLWTFSTLEGITPAIKEILTGFRATATRRAADLPDHWRVSPEMPPGHAPVAGRVQRRNMSVVFFHTDLNPFPGNYENMRGMVEGKPPAIILRDLYGWTEDTRSRAWPSFGGWNLIDPEQLPESGTNYQITDPAGSRPWATLWVRVAPGKPSRFYIYRDWPDARRYGPWATASRDPHQPDGDSGPAQRNLAYGWVKYKQTWLAEESVRLGVKNGQLTERDPHRRNLLERALAKAALKEPWGEAAVAWAQQRGLDGEPVREVIRERIIDPRASRNPSAVAAGGTCPIDELLKENRDPKTGELLAPRMLFTPAAVSRSRGGFEVETGIQAVGALLEFDREQPLCPLVNEPRLYVVRSCEQVIWTMENYTGQGGENAGCKDFADLLRYMAMSDLRHVTAGTERSKGGGSY